MKFGRLRIENFMSVNNVEIYLNDMGLVLISGVNDDAKAFDSNGSGKSTIFTEAPCWALFGTTIRGVTADDVISRNAGKNTCVSLEIIDDNGDVYTICRYRKHKEYKNSVMLFHNGENITCKSDTDTTKYIENLIDMDFLSFTNSVVFGQGISKMFAQATDSEQKQILERMLQIDIFRACQDLAKQHLAHEDKVITDASTGIEYYSKSRTTLLEEIEELQQKEAQAEARITKEIEECGKELSKYMKQLQEIPSTEQLEDDKQYFTGLMEQVQKKIDGYKQYEDSKTELLADAKSVSKEIVCYEKKVTDDKLKLESIKNGKYRPQTCEACGQRLPQEDTSHIQRHLADNIKSNSDKVVELKDELSETNNLLKKIEICLAGKAKLETQKSELHKELSQINADIRANEKSKSDTQRLIDRVHKEMKDLEQQRGVAYADMIAKKITLAEELEQNIYLQQQILDLAQKEYEKYNFWVNGFGNKGIKSVLLDSVTPYLNKRANYYLSQLADNTIGVNFTTQVPLKNGEMKDKFSVGVSNDNGGDAYKANSGGEKKRVDIAINMALQDLVHSRSNKRIDFIVYDEVFDALDASGCETVIGLLQEKARQYGTVLVITHNDSLKELFTKSILVSKHRKVTTLSEQLL